VNKLLLLLEAIASKKRVIASEKRAMTSDFLALI
jgi:hypothetical protein